MWHRCPICGEARDAENTSLGSSECVECGHRAIGDRETFASIASATVAQTDIQIDVASERVSPPAYQYSPQDPPSGGATSEPTSRSPRKIRGSIQVFFGVAACMIMVAKRENVVRFVPASASVFAALKMPVNLQGLAFQNVKSRLADENGQRVLAVDGEVASIRSTPGKLPDFMVEVRSDDGRTVYSWVSPAPKQNIAAGETVYFRARLAAPPMESKDIKVQFASAEIARSRGVK
jgi:hypothetical protein